MIVKNGKEITAIYKNGKEIVERYKGDRLVYSSGTEVESTFLSRTTADGMTIKDASMAKAVSVKGNSIVKDGEVIGVNSQCLPPLHYEAGSLVGFGVEERGANKTSLLPINTSNFPNGLHGINGVQDEHTPKQDVKRIGIAKLSSLYWIRYRVPSTGAFVYYAKAYSGYTSNKQVSQIATCAAYIVDDSNVPGDKHLSYNSLYIGGGNCLMVRDDSISTADELKMKFTDSDKVVYVLVDPVITPCDDPMAFEAYDQGTESVLGSDAPITLKAKYKKG